MKITMTGVPHIKLGITLPQARPHIGEAVNEATQVLLDVAAKGTPFHDSRTKLGAEPVSLDGEKLAFSHADQVLKMGWF